MHGALIIANVHMDGDTLRESRRLVKAATFSDAWTARGSHEALYVTQSPVQWAIHRAAGGSFLDTAKWMTFAAASLTCWLLWETAGALGAGPAGRTIAAILPWCWHGMSFITATCDDNVTTNLLRLVAILGIAAALKGDERIGESGRSVNGMLPVSLFSGILIGLAIAWHFQSVLLVPGAAVAFFLRRNSMPDWIKRAAICAVTAGLTYAVALGAAIAFGLLATVPIRDVMAAWTEHHRSGPQSVFLPAMGPGAGGPFRLVVEGWARMTAGFEWLRPPGWRGWMPVLLTLLGFGFVARCANSARRTPLGAAIAGVLIVQAAHSLLYEPWSVERWDLPALLSGLLVVAAAAERDAADDPKCATLFRFSGLALAASLMLANVFGWSRLIVQGPAAFAAALNGGPSAPNIELDAVGAHRELWLAARRTVDLSQAGGGFLGLVQRKLPNGRAQFEAINRLGDYLEMARPGLIDRKDPQGVGIAFVDIPKSGFVEIDRFGFVILVRRTGTR